MLTIESLLRRYWWTLVVRGLVAVAFGVLTFFWPGPTIAVLIALFGAYALFDGVAGIVAGIKSIGREDGWWPPLAGGIVSLFAAVVAFFMPSLTLMALLFLIAAWAVLHGIIDIFLAIRLRKAIDGEWLLAFGGTLSILFGLVIVSNPAAGALAVVWWIGAYAFVFGVVLIACGLRLRTLAHA